MRKMLAVVLTLFLFAGAPAPAGADCCDDILSCAAAIATDGLTCVVIETINVVTHLMGVVKNVKDNLSGDVESAGRAAQQQVTDTINTFKSQVQMSKDQFATSEQLAANLYNQEANGRMVALKNPARDGVDATTASPSSLSKSSLPSTVVAPSNSAAVPRPSAATPSNTAPSTTKASPSRTSGRAISPNAVRSTPSPIPTPAPATPNSTLADTQKLNTAVSQQSMNAAQQPRPLAGVYADPFSRGVAEIKRLRMAGERDAVRVYSSMQVASATSNQENAARAIELAQKAITAPLAALGEQLAAMLRDPSKIFDPSAAVNSEIDHVFATVDTSIQQMVDSITADAQKQFDAAQPAYTELQMDATRAARIAAAMDALHRDRSPEALDALNGLLPKSAASTINERGTTAMLTSNQMSHIQVMSKFTAGKLKVGGPSRTKVQEISTGFTQLKTLQSRALTIRASLPNLKSNLSQKMNSYLTGRTAAEIASQKEQLVVQARTRFANDPRTREAVINLLNSEAAKRQVTQRH